MIQGEILYALGLIQEGQALLDQALTLNGNLRAQAEEIRARNRYRSSAS